MAKKKTKKRQEAISIFDFLTAITYTKEDLTVHPEFEKLYNPFMINRWLSMSKETVFAAVYGNDLLGVPKALHFKFLQQFIEKQKVYFSYKKGTAKEDTEAIKVVSEYYNVREEVAKEIVYILTSDQLNKIKSSFGGRK